MSALYTFNARDAVATRCVDTWCFTEIHKNLSIIASWITLPASGWRWHVIGRPTALADKRSHLSTDNAEKLLILEENLLNWSDIRRWLTESGIRQKITICPSLIFNVSVGTLLWCYDRNIFHRLNVTVFCVVYVGIDVDIMLWFNLRSANVFSVQR